MALRFGLSGDTKLKMVDRFRGVREIVLIELIMSNLTYIWYESL